jgi:hypothetical protein
VTAASCWRGSRLPHRGRVEEIPGKEVSRWVGRRGWSRRRSPRSWRGLRMFSIAYKCDPQPARRRSAGSRGLEDPYAEPGPPGRPRPASGTGYKEARRRGGGRGGEASLSSRISSAGCGRPRWPSAARRPAPGRDLEGVRPGMAASPASRPPCLRGGGQGPRAAAAVVTSTNYPRRVSCPAGPRPAGGGKRSRLPRIRALKAISPVTRTACQRENANLAGRLHGGR